MHIVSFVENKIMVSTFTLRILQRKRHLQGNCIRIYIVNNVYSLHAAKCVSCNLGVICSRNTFYTQRLFHIVTKLWLQITSFSNFFLVNRSNYSQVVFSQGIFKIFYFIRLSDTVGNDWGSAFFRLGVCVFGFALRLLRGIGAPSVFNCGILDEI